MKESIDYTMGVEYIHPDTDTVYIVTTAADAENLERNGWKVRPRKLPTNKPKGGKPK